MQGGNVSVISVPWEGTRCSVTDRQTALTCMGQQQVWRLMLEPLFIRHVAG